MGNERDDWISTRAYFLWEQAGRPEGQDGAHWAQAIDEWEKIDKVRTSPAAAPGFDDGDEWEE